MANAKNIAEGLLILVRYEPDGYTDAQHDILYAGPELELSDEPTLNEYDEEEYSVVGPVSLEDQKKLAELGWHVSDVNRYAVFT